MYVIFVHICCRAPRGARGLKFSTRGYQNLIRGVAPREGRVD